MTAILLWDNRQCIKSGPRGPGNRVGDTTVLYEAGASDVRDDDLETNRRRTEAVSAWCVGGFERSRETEIDAMLICPYCGWRENIYSGKPDSCEHFITDWADQDPDDEDPDTGLYFHEATPGQFTAIINRYLYELKELAKVLHPRIDAATTDDVCKEIAGSATGLPDWFEDFCIEVVDHGSASTAATSFLRCWLRDIDSLCPSLSLDSSDVNPAPGFSFSMEELWAKDRALALTEISAVIDKEVAAINSVMAQLGLDADDDEDAEDSQS